jgi:hypothetical protein
MPTPPLHRAGSQPTRVVLPPGLNALGARQSRKHPARAPRKRVDADGHPMRRHRARRRLLPPHPVADPQRSPPAERSAPTRRRHSTVRTNAGAVQRPPLRRAMQRRGRRHAARRRTRGERRQRSGERRQRSGERRQRSGERRQRSGERRQRSGERCPPRHHAHLPRRHAHPPPRHGHPRTSGPIIRAFPSA